MRMTLSGSRTEFLSSEALGTGDIQYGRGGGCFVSTRRLLVAAALAVAALVAVGLLVFYLAPCPPGGCRGSPTSDGSSAGRGGSTEPSSAAGTTPPPIPPQELRLPSALRPVAYDLWLQPFIGDGSNFTFKGLVEIQLRCGGDGSNACSSISLHVKDLNLTWDSVTLRKLPSGVSLFEAEVHVSNNVSDNATSTSTTPAPSSDSIRITNHEVSTPKEMVTFSLERAMDVGSNYSLRIPYWGNVSASLSGFYRSNYTGKDGVNRWLAVTHFEATSARKAFPCFDEPAMKAHFRVHVARRPPQRSLSNMPLATSQPIAEEPGWMWDHYEPSPVMSTYLVAVIVSELAEQNASRNGTKPDFNVVARPELLPTAAYALDVGPRILDHYATYFNMAYPLPKMTMAAVPDFAAGAMENWGLIMYRESLMLYDSKTSTELSLYNVASVVAHELAHQWFGNIVTMTWWTDLWLNEGFATYVSYIGVNHVEPTWNILEKIVTEEMHPVLETDSLNSTHPVSVEVSNPSQISEVFDEVSYNKGASLIRMLNHSLTEPVFRAGLSSYLHKWAWSNAEQDNLWSALTGAVADVAGPNAGLLPAGASVKAVMDTWTLQKGYPLLTAKRDYQTGTVSLSQRPFSLHMHANDSADPSDKRAWHIPVSYATGDNASQLQDTRPRAWLSSSDTSGISLNITTPGSRAWLLLNIQQTGYYRVNYDQENWRLLIDLLHTSPQNSLPASSKAQLISDAFNLARAGQLSYSTPLNLTLYLQRETNPSPWYAFLWSHSFLDDMLSDSSHYPYLQAYARRLLRPLADSLGIVKRDSDTQPQRHLRTAALSRLIYAEDPQMLIWARAQFEAWLNASADANPVPVDMRMSVYCCAARWGGTREWEALEARFRAADDLPNERSSLLRALMCTRQTHLITTMLERSLEQGGGIRLQDSIHVWRAAPNNPVAAGIAFRYLRERWDDIYNKYKKVSFVLKGVLRSTIAGLSTKTDLEDAEAFVAAHKTQFESVSRTVAQAMEWLRLRVRWRQEFQDDVAEWFTALETNSSNPRNSSTTGTTTSTTGTGTSGSTGTTGTTGSTGTTGNTSGPSASALTGSPAPTAPPATTSSGAASVGSSAAPTATTTSTSTSAPPSTASLTASTASANSSSAEPSTATL